jgi:hypothetical protein
MAIMGALDYLSKGKKAKTINVFGQFLYNAHNSRLSPKEAKQNLEKGLIELNWESEDIKFSNGLLITENGYFVTSDFPEYPIKNGNSEMFKIKYNSQSFPIEKIILRDKKSNLVLGKIKIEAQYQAMQYSFLDSSGLPLNIPVGLLLFKYNGSLVEKKGKIQELEKNLFKASFESEHNDSGSVVMDNNCSLIGLLDKPTIYSNSKINPLNSVFSEGFNPFSSGFSIFEKVQKFAEATQGVETFDSSLCINSNRILELIAFARKS